MELLTHDHVHLNSKENPREITAAGAGVGVSTSTHQIMKGKRTKRHRPVSPFPVTRFHPPTTTSTTTTSDEPPTSDICSTGVIKFLNHTSSSASNNAADENRADSATEEEVDMAHCLILLARGPDKTVIDEPRGAHKFNSRKFAVGPVTGCSLGTTRGNYMYECKTCSKTFPSFQALGGHRASHKKPKLPGPKRPNNEEPNKITESPSLALQIYNNATRVHECGICGAVFNSGQALGGHMRRHRAPASNMAAPAAVDSGDTEDERRRLDLDLNLPAPAEEQPPSPPQTPLVFLSSALVDCHY